MAFAVLSGSGLLRVAMHAENTRLLAKGRTKPVQVVLLDDHLRIPYRMLCHSSNKLSLLIGKVADQ